MTDFSLPLRVIEAKENNLKGITVELPHNRLISVTGLSGSGKSSFAFRTVYAEGQRRYIETFSPYTRQFFDRVKKPDLLAMENVRPAIAIEQRTRITSSRSSVGSITGLNDLLKIIWSNLSEPYCPKTGKKLIRWTAASLLEEAKRILDSKPDALLIGTTLEVPVKKELKELEVERLVNRGYHRVFDRDSLTIKKLGEFDPAEIGEQLTLILDRVRPGKLRPAQLLDSIEQGFLLSKGIATYIVQNGDKYEIKDYSSDYTHPDGIELEQAVPLPRPALFDANSPIGACENCKGFGKVLEIDPEKVISNPTLSISEDALQCWTGKSTRAQKRRLLKFCEENSIPLDKAWNKLTRKQQEEIFNYRSRSYRGVYPWFKSMERKAYKMHVRVFLSRYRSQVECPTCQGKRLKPAALQFKVDNLSLGDIWDLPVSQLLKWVDEQLKAEKAKGSRDLKEILLRAGSRLTCLVRLGLPYITLGRQSRTLSGGETQRVNLATALGSELVSTEFVLDEPSVGLHPRDTDRLISALRELTDKGNSVVVVEHDLECIEAGDHILELGPGAGASGGDIVYSGTGSNWPGLRVEPLKLSSRTLPKKLPAGLAIKNAAARNLKIPELKIPSGLFISLTGVSGSGKSSLVQEVIMRAFDNYSKGISTASKDNLVSGFENFGTAMLVDQSGLARSPRANIATYSGIWEQIRIMLSKTEDAEVRGLSKSSFSFNVEGGRCPECKGAGHIKEDMQFLSDVYVECEVCLGKRFQQKPLEVRIKGKNAYDWLQTTIDQISVELHGNNKVREAAETLSRLGLGHLRLGHPLSELSGGEAQRLKLVPFIQKGTKSESALLIFDEPTTGLHLADVQRLIEVLRDLTSLGHTVLCIEHNQEVILTSDWIIDLGPEGGDDGGSLVLCGSPDDFLKSSNSKKSHTARHLQIYSEKAKSRGTRVDKNGDISRFKTEKTPGLKLVGAKEHNLKDLTFEIPHNQVVAITGRSGSGKSTIAKDIIYAEGQRRYLDCLSPYARQYIRELSKPDIEEIKNVRPTVCVYQHTFQPPRNSTIGTMSEVYNFLRLLYAKAGDQFCPEHPDQLVSAQDSEEIARSIKEIGSTEIRLLAPVVKLKKGTHKAVLERATRQEINEVRVDGIFGTPATFIGELEKAKVHTIEYVWGRFIPSRIPLEMIAEAVEEVFALGGGTVILNSDNEDLIFSRERSCPICNRGFFRPDPEDFSFSSRRGRCRKCEGTGLNSRGDNCSTCSGQRLKKEALAVRIQGKNIFELCQGTAPDILEFLESVDWQARLEDVATPILRELRSRLETILELGLDYLPLNRACKSISAGELQRLRISAALGIPLSGSMYIFDEPSAGLHPYDNHRVLKRIHELKQLQNSVVLIEHDEESILTSDHILEVGPGGGAEGGEVIYNGAANKYDRSHLEPSHKTTELEEHKVKVVQGELEIISARKNNLKNISATLPLGKLVVVGGVSGAGKSSLITGVALEALLDGIKKMGPVWEAEHGSVSSSIDIDRVKVVDQSPIGKNSRSTPASYLKLWDQVRKLFASTVAARARGKGPSFFSFNTGKGRCPECKGQGRIKLEMSFLSEAYVTCDLCSGSRFTDEAISYRYLDHSISDVLGLTFAEAKTLFSNHPKIYRPLYNACELGLGYLSLGQSSTSLSGGESQRIKLVSELSARPRGHTLYVLDEPTRGLHRKDVSLLIDVLNRLIQSGNSVIVIEHDHDMIRACDHFIELGPGPGEDGGEIIFEGSPKELLKSSSPWGQILSNGNPFIKKAGNR